MGISSPKRPLLSMRESWRERTVQAALSVILWWAVYWRVAGVYDPIGGIIAATVAAWGYVLVSTYAAYLINRKSPGGGRGKGSGTPGNRWPRSRP